MPEIRFIFLCTVVHHHAIERKLIRQVYTSDILVTITKTETTMILITKTLLIFPRACVVESDHDSLVDMGM